MIPRSVAPWLRVGLAALVCLAVLAPTVARADTDLTVGGQAHVAYAAGDNVRLRTGPGYDNDTIEMVPEGTVLDVLDGPFTANDGSVWYKVATGGDTGYIVSDYLAAGAASSDASSAGTADAGSTADAGAASTAGTDSASGTDSAAQSTGGTTATVTTALNLRSGPSLADNSLLVIPSGAAVTLTGQSQDGFQSASYQGTDGWVFGGYLDSGSTSGSTSDASSSNGGSATTTDVLNLRDGPSYSNGIIVVMPAGAAVTLTGESENGFLSVDYQGTDGWAVGSYLDTGSGTTSGDGSSPSTTPAAEATSAATDSNQASGGSGQAIVNYAMQYLGYPYVAATHGPDSFDCSGFTYWVVLHVLGIDIGTGLPTQVAAGTPVDQSNLQPGDLVFFQNTFEAGLSHVGIYIGNGQFIHAENPSTGVVISSLSDPYYQADWYGAVRLV